MAIVADTQRPIPAPRKLPRDERRVQLIEATIKTIARHGFARTTMSEVARVADLSHGLVNFHFQSKENLLIETLLYMAEEYRQNWMDALANAPKSAADQINAMLLADFNPQIFTPDRLSAWCSFWGEAQSRPIYQENCGSNDKIYNMQIEALCARMNSEHGYSCNPSRVSRLLRVAVEGVWLDMMTLSEPYDLQEARATVMTCVAAFFDRHFTAEGLLLTAG